MRFTTSAFRHGLDESAIEEILRAPIYSAILRGDPLKVVVVGVISTSSPPVEVVYVQADDRERVVIHAMRASRALINQARRARRRSE